MARTNPLLQAALFYAASMKWPVFPLKPRGKEPLTKHGYKDATLDREQILAWWKKWPSANIGVPTGIAFFVVDIDPRNGGDDSYELLIRKHGRLPDTLQQMTGGGGRHLLFAAPEGTTIGCGELAQGIDIKGKGGYIVVAPSIHPSGRAYFWDGEKPIKEQTIASAPTLKEFEAASRNGHGTAPAGDGVKLPDRIAKGKQHATLFKLGCAMRAKNFGETEIFAALWEANRARCEEPGPEENIRKLAASICMQYEAGSTVKTQPVSDRNDSKTPKPIVRQESLVIYHADYPEPEPLVDAILYPGLTILGGRPKVGKSWLALDLAISLVSGKKFGGYLEVKKPGRCLYVSLEERPRQTRSRLRVLTQPSDYLSDLHFIYELPPLMAGGAAVLSKELTEHPVELLIVDSLLAVTKQAGRRNMDIMQADYNIVSTLREIAEKHAMALVLVAHTRKAPGEFLDSIQGTSGTTAAADAVWVLSRTPDGDAMLSVTGREVRSNVFGVKRSEDSPAWAITGEGDEVSQSEARREIIELLRDQGPMRPTSIARAARKNVGGVHRLLSKLCEAGLVVRTHHGTYQILAGPKEERQK